MALNACEKLVLDLSPTTPIQSSPPIPPPTPFSTRVVRCVSQIAKQVLEQTRKFSLFRLRYFS